MDKHKINISMKIKKNKIYYLLSLSLMFLLFGYINPRKNVLIIGDSISLGYTPFVKVALSQKAIVKHNKGNAEFTSYGLQNLDGWLGNEKWDVIQFNWGLWDLCYRDTAQVTSPKNLDKVNGVLTTSLEIYKSNLEAIIKRLKKTNAKLIFVTTTYVPEDEPGRYSKDVFVYNNIALKIMRKNHIQVTDLYETSVEAHKKFGMDDKNVHYKKEGYEMLSKVIVQGIEKAL